MSNRQVEVTLNIKVTLRHDSGVDFFKPYDLRDKFYELVVKRVWPSGSAFSTIIYLDDRDATGQEIKATYEVVDVSQIQESMI